MAPVKLALLICDVPIPAIITEHGDYLQIFTTWLHNSLRAALGASVDPDEHLLIDGYDVRAGDYPDLKNYDGIVLTGSCMFFESRRLGGKIAVDVFDSCICV